MNEASENGRRSVAGAVGPFALGLAAALGWIGWRAWVHQGHVVDDAFISLRHVANLLAGRGLVFNPELEYERPEFAGTPWATPRPASMPAGPRPTRARWCATRSRWPCR